MGMGRRLGRASLEFRLQAVGARRSRRFSSRTTADAEIDRCLLRFACRSGLKSALHDAPRGSGTLDNAAASWSAVALHRFWEENVRWRDRVARRIRLPSLSDDKAPQAWRTPRRSAWFGRVGQRDSVLECGGPPPLLGRERAMERPCGQANSVAFFVIG
jgi:hypothetical protein